MAGRIGHAKRTVQNLKVRGVDVDKGVLLVNGAIPGPKGSVVKDGRFSTTQAKDVFDRMAETGEAVDDAAKACGVTEGGVTDDTLTEMIREEHRAVVAQLVNGLQDVCQGPVAPLATIITPANAAKLSIQPMSPQV